jgi:hypothetical protein
MEIAIARRLHRPEMAIDRVLQLRNVPIRMITVGST